MEILNVVIIVLFMDNLGQINIFIIINDSNANFSNYFNYSFIL